MTSEGSGFIPIQDYEITESKTRNVLIMGDSRAGKTTFIKYLMNLNHSIDSEIYRGTVDPESRTVSIKIGSSLMNINFIDTPGLNELSENKSRGDSAIFELISSFVRKDITKVHMVLITANVASGLTKNNIETIMNIGRELGKDLLKNVFLLVTNYENFSEDDESKLIDKIHNDNQLSIIKITCKGGILFTGAISKSQHQDVRLRDKFMNNQKNRIIKFLNILLQCEETSIRSDRIDQMASRFKSFESVVRDYQTAINLKPEIQELIQIVVKERMRLSKSLDKLGPEMRVTAEELINRSSHVGTIEQKDTIIEEAEKKLSNHLIEARAVSDKVAILKTQNDELIELQTELKRLSYMIDMI